MTQRLRALEEVQVLEQQLELELELELAQVAQQLQG
jgi:hypothetical protein